MWLKKPVKGIPAKDPHHRGFLNVFLVISSQLSSVLDGLLSIFFGNPYSNADQTCFTLSRSVVSLGFVYH
jgi:hypothetical protein